MELGLKFHYREGADITLASVDTRHRPLHATSGNEDATHSLVNFDFVVNTGFNGGTDTLADSDFKMVDRADAGLDDQNGRLRSGRGEPRLALWKGNSLA